MGDTPFRMASAVAGVVLFSCSIFAVRLVVVAMSKMKIDQASYDSCIRVHKSGGNGKITISDELEERYGADAVYKACVENYRRAGK